MNLGISVTKSEIRLAMRKGSGYKGMTISGCDATSYSKMPASVFASLKSELLKCIDKLNSSNEQISSIVVSYPIAFTFIELLDLKKLFQTMGIKVNRYIDNGMSCGLAATLTVPNDFEGYVCCANRADNCTELSLLCIDDGVIETFQNTTYFNGVNSAGKTIGNQLNDWKNDYDAKVIYCQPSEASTFAYGFAEASSPEIKPIMDEYAASMGALLRAEMFNGIGRRFLPIEVFPDYILCVVNGEAEAELLQPDNVLPTAHSVEISTNSPERTEIELISVNNCTGNRSSVFKTSFASLPGARTVKASVSIDVNKTVSVIIDTEGSHIELRY